MARNKVTDKDKEKIVKLSTEKNMTCREIEAVTGVSKTKISEILQDVKGNPDTLLFRDNKADVFEGLQAKLINLADDELLKKMLSKRGFTDVGILNDKIRELRGEAGVQVTVNVLHSLVEQLPALQRQIEAYESGNFVGETVDGELIAPPDRQPDAE